MTTLLQLGVHQDLLIYRSRLIFMITSRFMRNCLPRDQSLSDLLYSWKFEARNSLNLAVTAVTGQH